MNFFNTGALERVPRQGLSLRKVFARDATSRAAALLRASGTSCAAELITRDRGEAAAIHADIELPRDWLQPPMAVTMQVDRAAMRAIPGPKRIMAENHHGAVQHELRVGLNAQPACSENRWPVIVSGDQVFASIELRQDRRPGLRDRKISKVPDLVIRSDPGIPAVDQHRVHLGDRGERSTA